MTNSRETILNKLHAVRRPFPDAPPRPLTYLPVTQVEDTRPQALFQRFAEVLEGLNGRAYLVDGDEGARAQVLGLLREHGVDHVLAWDFKYIPVDGLQDALAAAGFRVSFPELHGPDRQAVLDDAKEVGAGIIGADAVAAATGTLIVSTAPGRGRLPTVLPLVLIAVVTLDQVVPHLESWLARERAGDLATVRTSANLCFISGPSRTGDIEMQTVLGVHGPGVVLVVVKQQGRAQ